MDNNLKETVENGGQFEVLFKHASIGIIITNKEGNIIDFNEQAESQFGYKKEEIVGKNVDLLVPKNVQHSHSRQREVFYQKPGPRRMGEGRDLFGRKKDDTEFPVEVSLCNYKINNDLFVIAFVIDISVRKKSESVVLEQKAELERITSQIKKLNIDLEQKVEYRTKMLRETLTELEKSKEELSASLEKEKELNELKSRFVTTASHEFRTPLSTILSSSFLLEKYNQLDEPAKREKHIHRIKNAVADMKSILEDFLSLGKLEEGLIKINFADTSSDTLFYEIQNILSDMETLTKKGQQIIFKHEGEGSIYIDPLLFKNILNNLISNAIKFSPENASIEIDCKLTQEDLRVSVRDHGIGISEEDQQHLFERFFRAKNAVNIQGTGLGLHIVTKYLELMDGHIEIKSKLNEGTDFTFSIPKNKNQQIG